VALANAASLNVAPVTQAATNWPSLIESILVVVAIAALLPSFERVATRDEGRDARFGDVAIAIGGLPARVLPSLCASFGALAEPRVRDRLCARPGTKPDAAQVDGLPVVLVDALARTARAFQRPLAEAGARRDALRLQQREGLGNLPALDQAIVEIDTHTQPYIERYALDRRSDGLPRPLACAVSLVKASPARADATQPQRGGAAPATALLLLGAALDGEGALPALAGAANLPATARPADGPCAGMVLRDALAQSSVLMGDAREARLRAAKNEAMRDLLRSAGWQWAGWMIAGFLLLKLSRRSHVVFAGIGLALLLWALAAWIGRVPWPLGADRDFQPGRVASALLSAPAPFVLGLLGVAAASLCASLWLDRRLPAGAQTIASRVGYPGLVVATGLGWLLLLDLSANGNFSNRYLALYHQGHLWLAMLTLSVIVFLRQSIGRALGWTLSMVDALAGSLRRSMGPLVMASAVLLLLLGLVAMVGALLPSRQQLTSELGRLWLIAGASWFFFLRGDPLAERLAGTGTSLGSLLRYVSPLLGVALVVIGVQLITRYLGPLLIACYSAGAFIAASIAMWWHQRSGAYRGAFALAMLLFVAWIVATSVALFALGGLDDVTAGRLENLAAPLASANDQLALVTWFQRAAPPAGFGLGAVPWCGHGSAAACAGVPTQIQSDYTLTALVGVFGWTTAWAVTIGAAIWLHRLIRHHGRVTRGEPRLIRVGQRIVNDDQALLSWVGLTWVVLALCQLAVTVAGNLAVLPLTGVTFPFVSFGMTSLVVNMALLGLCINVNRPSPPADA
jgi:cell division protein FtsW (lipid II flippase)